MSGETTNRFRTYSELIRFKNLLFLVYLQSSIYWLACLNSHSDNPSLSVFVFVIALPTFLIGSFGNAVNDYFDYETDLANSKRSAISEKLSKESIKTVSYSLAGLSSLAIIIPELIFSNSIITAILAISFVCLFFYSFKLKCTPVIGNLLIGVLAGLSLYIPILIVYSNSKMDANLVEFPIFILGFIFFVFIVSLIRELVKDLEDLHGDQEQRCKTLAVTKGESFTKNIVLALAIFFILILMSWAQNFSMIMNGYIMLFCMLPMMLICGLIVRSNNYNQISLYLKLLMISSSFLIFIFHFTHQA